MLTTSVQKVHLPIKVIIPRIVTNLLEPGPETGTAAADFLI